MNLLMNVAIGLVFVLMPFQSTNAQAPYCNERFHFCSGYPAPIFSHKTDLDGNGVLLETADRTLSLRIAAEPCPNGLTAREVFEKTAAQLSPDPPTIISSIFGEDFYECFFLSGKDAYYHKAYLFEGHFVRIVLRAPLNQPGRMQMVRENLTLEFPAAETTVSAGLGSRK